MALIICSECGKQVSDKALTCPNCGNPIQKQVLEERKMNQKISCCARCGVSGSSAWWKKVADGTHCVFCNSTSVIASGLTRKEVLEAREAEDSGNYDHDNPDPVNDWIVRNVAILSDEFQWQAYKKRLEQQRKDKELLKTIPRIPKEKCPKCQSTDIKIIGSLERSMSAYVWGLGSGKIGKQFKCRDCGHMW